MSSEKVLHIWTDPLGRKIALSAGGWSGHIVSRHPGMASRLQDVEETITDPDEIWKAGIRRFYYRKYPGRRPNVYLEVIVKLKSNEYKADGYVASAYPVPFQKDKGALEWQGN